MEHAQIITMICSTQTFPVAKDANLFMLLFAALSWEVLIWTPKKRNAAHIPLSLNYITNVELLVPMFLQTKPGHLLPPLLFCFVVIQSGMDSGPPNYVGKQMVWLGRKYWTNNDSAVFTIPARLALWCKVFYADGSNELLAVQSLNSDGIMPPCDRMFFSRGGYLDTSYNGLCLVALESILSTAFVIPALPPATKIKIPKQSDLLDALMHSNYYIALPARAEWSVLGLDKLLPSEISK